MVSGQETISQNATHINAQRALARNQSVAIRTINENGERKELMTTLRCDNRKIEGCYCCQGQSIAGL